MSLHVLEGFLRAEELLRGHSAPTIEIVSPPVLIWRKQEVLGQGSLCVRGDIVLSYGGGSRRGDGENFGLVAFLLWLFASSACEETQQADRDKEQGYKTDGDAEDEDNCLLFC